MALPPAPPTPITLIRGRSSSTSGRMKSMLIATRSPARYATKLAHSGFFLHDRFGGSSKMLMFR
jgi:hypothetical protein